MPISEVIKQELKRQRIPVSVLSQKTGYSPEYLYALLRQKKRWNEDVLTKVCKVLGLQIELRPTGTNGS